MTDLSILPATAVFAALADPTRRQLFELIAARPRSVGDVARHLPVSRPAVSQHLRVLADARLVTARPEGTRRVYALERTGLAAARAYLERFWDRVLLDFATAAEAAAREAASPPATTTRPPEVRGRRAAPRRPSPGQPRPPAHRRRKEPR